MRQKVDSKYEVMQAAAIGNFQKCRWSNEGDDGSE